MDFGSRLKELRKEYSVTQEELANILQVRRPAISGYETKNQQPDFDRLIKLANFFNVTTDYLLGRSNIRNTEKPMKEEQHEILSIFNKLSSNDKKRAIGLIRLLADSSDSEVEPEILIIKDGS